MSVSLRFSDAAVMKCSHYFLTQGSFDLNGHVGEVNRLGLSLGLREVDELQGHLRGHRDRGTANSRLYRGRGRERLCPERVREGRDEEVGQRSLSQRTPRKLPKAALRQVT